MPIKKDGTGKRWVEMEVLLPGTPEQIWHAMATGPGIAAWFLKGNIEPRVGGAFSLDFGHGVTVSGEVTAWDPPHRFGYVERDWQPGAPPVATEITITSRSGDRCVMRMVHSLFASTDEWDDQMEGFEAGWPGFFGVLRVYLAHFAGAKAASFMAIAPSPDDDLAAWRRLGESLGFAGVNVGEQVKPASGPESWSGVIEHVHQDAQQRYVLVRTADPSPGVVLLGTQAAPVDLGDVEIKVGKRASTNVSVCRYYYGANAESLATDGEQRWRAWLAEAFQVEGAGVRPAASPAPATT
jgi:uncharacterized protein YndB with AHSA1/START domain